MVDLKELADERGLAEGTLDWAGLVVVEDGQYDGWYGIPYRNATGIWKWRYRHPDRDGRPKYQDEFGAKFHLYNPGVLGPGHPEVWFCEGEFDTLVLWELGVPAIGIHGTANVGTEDDSEEGRVPKSWALLFENSKVTVAFDNDEAGHRAGRRLAAGLNGVMFEPWANYGDLNEWYKADPVGLERAVERFREHR